MLNAANWTARLNELATEANVPGLRWASGAMFVLRSGDDEPWAPVSFGQLADGTPYLLHERPGGPPRRLSHRRSAVSGRIHRLFGHQVRAAVRRDEPWAPVSFDQLADGTPYLYMSGRVAPRVG